MEATLDPTTGDVKAQKPRPATSDKAIKELMALKESYFPLNKTPGNKQLRIHKVSNTSLVRVQWADGGVLPQELSGMWTSSKLAQDAVSTYLTKVWAVALDGA